MEKKNKTKQKWGSILIAFMERYYSTIHNELFALDANSLLKQFFSAGKLRSF